MSLKKVLSQLLWAIPILVLITVLSVVICFSTSAMVMLQLKALGVSHHKILAVGILVACGTQAFIWYFHKIKNYIIHKESQK